MGRSSIQVKATENYGSEICLRIVVFVLFVVLEVSPPFIREIQPEEIWLYRYPKATKPYLSELGGPVLKLLLEPLLMVVYPLLAIFITWYNTRDTDEMRQMYLIPTLSIPLTGFVINFIKIAVGRPRPNFMVTCYGDYYYLRYSDVSTPCTELPSSVLDARKSFPSGHTGLAFASFAFLTLYVAEKGKRTWLNPENRWKTILTFLTLTLLPILVGISRTCDYKHHWQDVLVGGLIGTLVTCIVYRLYSPGFVKYSFENEVAIPVPNSGSKFITGIHRSPDLNRNLQGYQDYNGALYN